MRKRRGFLLTALFFLVLCILVLTIFRAPIFFRVSGLIELLFFPVQRSVQAVYGKITSINESEKIKTLQEENSKLQEQIRSQKSLEADVKALRDQFQATTISSHTLLPAKIVGLRGLIPGMSLPTEIMIDKGKAEGIEEGRSVVYKNNLIGKVTKSSSHISQVELVYNKKTSLTGKTTKTAALGIINGQGNGTMLLKNVAVSEKLLPSDLIITNGDVDEKGKGYPPDLIVGKIISIDKKPSALFQSAELQSLVNIPKLTTVFILIKE